MRLPAFAAFVVVAGLTPLVQAEDRDVNVAVELRLVKAPANLYERIPFAFDCTKKTATLTEKQTVEFMEAVQSDRRTNVMQAPKLTMANGQAGAIQIGETRHFVTEMRRKNTTAGRSAFP